MQRVTKADVERSFSRLLKYKRKRKAKSNRDKGAWDLNYNSNYGGYVIVEYTKTGGEGTPFGSRRRTPRSFIEFVNTIINYGGRR